MGPLEPSLSVGGNSLLTSFLASYGFCSVYTFYEKLTELFAIPNFYGGQCTLINNLHLNPIWDNNVCGYRFNLLKSVPCLLIIFIARLMFAQIKMGETF